jgi:hypothetical protein
MQLNVASSFKKKRRKDGKWSSLKEMEREREREREEDKGRCLQQRMYKSESDFNSEEKSPRVGGSSRATDTPLPHPQWQGRSVARIDG